MRKELWVGMSCNRRIISSSMVLVPDWPWNWDLFPDMGWVWTDKGSGLQSKHHPKILLSIKLSQSICKINYFNLGNPGPVQNNFYFFSAFVSTSSCQLMSTAYGRDTVHFEWYVVDRINLYEDASPSLAAYQTIMQTLVRHKKISLTT